MALALAMTLAVALAVALATALALVVALATALALASFCFAVVSLNSKGGSDEVRLRPNLPAVRAS